MKRFLILVLALALSLGSISFAEEEDGIMPDYGRMEEKRVLIGKDVWGDPMYEFDGMNSAEFLHLKLSPFNIIAGGLFKSEFLNARNVNIVRCKRAFKLINVDNLLDLLSKYNVRFSSSYGTTVGDKEYYVIGLYDNSKYAFEVFSTYDFDYFITVEDFEIFCKFAIDPNFVFDE